MSFPMVELPPRETKKHELHVIVYTLLVDNPIPVR